jgi:hypothetical protein
MEMRTILSQLLRRFTFTLADVQRAAADAADRQVQSGGAGAGSAFLGVNRGTMGPRDPTKPPDVRRDGAAVPHLGLYVHAHTR